VLDESPNEKTRSEKKRGEDWEVTERTKGRKRGGRCHKQETGRKARGVGKKKKKRPALPEGVGLVTTSVGGIVHHLKIGWGRTRGTGSSGSF